MTFDEILAQIIDLLKRQGSVSYRALKVRFDIDDEYLDVLKEEIIDAQQLAERFPETTEHQPELLAHHLTEAGFVAQAVDYWHKAGAKAIQRCAHVEAIAHLRTGLALLKTLPETSERVHHELDMLLILGPALMAMKSYAAAEVEHTYGRARALCQQMEDSSQLFPILWGLWLFYLIQVDLQVAQELGEQLLTLVQRGPDTTRLVEAHYALGSTLNYLGEFPAAQAQLRNPQLPILGACDTMAARWLHTL